MKGMIVHLQEMRLIISKILCVLLQKLGLDQWSEPFITPNSVKMLFQSKLLDVLKIYIVSSIVLNFVALWSNYKGGGGGLFGDCYLIKCSH